jgi:type IV secretion system protein VirB10
MRLLHALLPVLFVGSSLAGQTALSQAPSQTRTEAAAQASTQPSAQPNSPERTPYIVPTGTKVLLQLNSAINTKSAKPGDGVYLTSIFPVVVGNRVMIPSGVYVQGVIDHVVRGGRIKGKSQLDMHFTSIIFPNGSVVEIPGMVNSLPGAKNQGVKNDGEGTIEQDGGKGRNAGEAAKIAIPTGAGVGTIGGAATGHPIEGGLAGLGAGLATVGIVSLFTRNADLEIPSGTQVEMLLQQPLKLQESNVAGSAATNVTLVPAADQTKPLPKPAPQQMVCAAGSFGCQ